MNKRFLLMLLITLFTCFFIINSQVKADCIGASVNYSCGDTVTQSCILNQSEIILGDSCFTIGTNDIVINGNGFNITGNKTDNTYGIYMDTKDNITIKNIQIYSFDTAIHLRSSPNNTITNNTINNSVEHGIMLEFSTTSNNNISNNNISFNALTGVYIKANNNTIENNTIYSNGLGISFAGTPEYNNITNNNVSLNDAHGISMTGANNVLNTNTFCYNNQDEGDYYDIYDGLNSGDNNTCDTTDNWNDTGTVGCTYSCLGIPSVSLVSPLNGNVTTNNFVNFSCNATDNLQLANMTLYWNYSGSWQANETVDVSGTENQTTFEKTGLSNGTILWNCQACDNDSQCNFANTNWSVTVNASPAAEQCSDGTAYGVCSTNLPLYCDSGTLVHRCSFCGCPSGYTCQDDTDDDAYDTCQKDGGGGGGGGGIIIDEPYCGDGVCDPEEDYENCNEDCCAPEGAAVRQPFNCCYPLIAVDPFTPSPISIKYCILCGDGICKEHENYINCPQDCDICNFYIPIKIRFVR